MESHDDIGRGRVHRRLVQATFAGWFVFAALFVISHGGDVLGHDRAFLAGVLLAPVMPMVVIAVTLATGGETQVLALLGLQAVAVLPWLAYGLRPRTPWLRPLAFAGVGLYWVVLFFHL